MAYRNSLLLCHRGLKVHANLKHIMRVHSHPHLIKTGSFPLELIQGQVLDRASSLMPCLVCGELATMKNFCVVTYHLLVVITGRRVQYSEVCLISSLAVSSTVQAGASPAIPSSDPAVWCSPTISAGLHLTPKPHRWDKENSLEGGIPTLLFPVAASIHTVVNKACI